MRLQRTGEERKRALGSHHPTNTLRELSHPPKYPRNGPEDAKPTPQLKVGRREPPSGRRARDGLALREKESPEQLAWKARGAEGLSFPSSCN